MEKSLMDLFESIYRFFGWWFINVDMLLIFFLLGGAGLLGVKKKKWGTRLLTTGCAGLVFLAIIPVGFWMLENLENRFPKIEDVPANAKGIILLGGSFDRLTSAGREDIAYNLAGGRFIHFVELAKAYPHLQRVYTGTRFEMESAKTEFRALGLDPASVLFEHNSKNTHQNASETAALIHPQPTDKWILVTSAYHMPRSVGLFRKAGFNVIPFPVDYHTPGHYELWFFMGLKDNLNAWHAGTREWLGMIINYIRGRSDELFPGRN